MNLRNRIADTIRRADGNHTMGAAALADAVADDLENMPALLAFALRDAFTETELMALQILVEGSEFRDMNYLRRLHQALGAAIDGREG
jgi:hypothetical protein